MKTKFRVLLIPLFIMAALLLVTYSCKDEKVVIPPTIPELLTSTVTSITETSAVCGGSIITNGGAEITAKGICWGTITPPTILSSKTVDTGSKSTYISSITGLTANTTYYVRAYATNSVGTAYGNTYTFLTLPILFVAGSGVTDKEGNTYTTVIIGTQEWMGSNLKTTKFNDDAVIPQVTVNTDWQHLTTPGYCWYKNDSSTYKGTYGALYNWHAVNSGKLCPTGWHIPTNNDWTTLETKLGADSMVGGRMKETGTTHWNSPNAGADNRGGFIALPAGSRSSVGDFESVGYDARWWSATELSPVAAWYRSVSYSNAAAQKGYGSKNYGYSVRCVKN